MTGAQRQPQPRWQEEEPTPTTPSSAVSLGHKGESASSGPRPRPRRVTLRARARRCSKLTPAAWPALIFSFRFAGAVTQTHKQQLAGPISSRERQREGRPLGPGRLPTDTRTCAPRPNFRDTWHAETERSHGRLHSASRAGALRRCRAAIPTPAESAGYGASTFPGHSRRVPRLQVYLCSSPRNPHKVSHLRTRSPQRRLRQTHNCPRDSESPGEEEAASGRPGRGRKPASNRAALKSCPQTCSPGKESLRRSHQRCPVPSEGRSRAPGICLCQQTNAT